MKINTILGDITKIDNVDVIVNAANSSLLGGGGVDGAIHRCAGPELLAECRKLHGCETGEAKITAGYMLPCKYVIHTVGPVWQGGQNNEEEKLSDCYYNSLHVAIDNGLDKIAFPSISTGVYGYPVDNAAKTAVDTVEKFLVEHPGTMKEIYFVLFDANTREVYQKEIDRIDYAKIEKALIQEENSDFIRLITLAYGKKEYRVCREKFIDIDSYTNDDDYRMIENLGRAMDAVAKERDISLTRTEVWSNNMYQAMQFIQNKAISENQEVTDAIEAICTNLCVFKDILSVLGEERNRRKRIYNILSELESALPDECDSSNEMLDRIVKMKKRIMDADRNQ